MNKIKQQLVLLLATLISSVFIGSVIAFFLWLLEFVTQYRNQHNYLLYFLPIAGVLIVSVYKKWGKTSAKGNNLLIAAVIDKKPQQVPFLMTPLVLFGTVITHLFGGSAGREGTAVQMGGSIAATIGRWLGISEDSCSILLKAGIAAGFSAVFGTPFTGWMFAMELLVIGKIQYRGFLFIGIAAFAAHYICTLYPIHHTHYHIITQLGKEYFSLLFWLKILLCGILFGMAANLFSIFIESFALLFHFVKNTLFIPIIGGIVIIVLAYIIGFDYLGLGVHSNFPGAASLTGAFNIQGVHTWSWFWKLLFTTITLSAGFKGGEVTPLFFIGAALGNTLGILLGLPIDLMAGLGFIAVFAGATNTPIACCIMGMELFGTQYTFLYLLVCFIAFYSNGLGGIYESQLIGGRKSFFLFNTKQKPLSQYRRQGILLIKRKWQAFHNRYL